MANTRFDVILLQETWFDDSIDSAEIIACTNFAIERSDRSKFDHSKTRGGGICILIHNTLQFTRIPVFEHTKFELNVVRIRTGNKFLIIINVYFPPYDSRRTLVHQLDEILSNLKRTYPSDEFVLSGDFNSSRTRWHHDDQTPGFLVNNATNISPYEYELLNMTSSHCLFQMMHTPNSLGNFLDLVFTTDISNLSICETLEGDLFDVNSIHHNAMSFVITFVATTQRNSKAIRNLFNLSQTGVKEDLRKMHYVPLSHDFIVSSLMGNSYTLFEHINCFTNTITDAQ